MPPRSRAIAAGRRRPLPGDIGQVADEIRERFQDTSGQGATTELASLAPTAAEALTALVESTEAGDEVFGVLVDEDLVKLAELHAGSLPNSVEGVMVLAAWHLKDHAEQITKARPALR